MSHGLNNGPADIVEAIRTSKKSAEQDVKLLKDIGGRHTWIEEKEDGHR